MSMPSSDTTGFETITLRNGPLGFTALAAGDPANHRGVVLLHNGFPDTADFPTRRTRSATNSWPSPMPGTEPLLR